MGFTCLRILKILLISWKVSFFPWKKGFGFFTVKVAFSSGNKCMSEVYFVFPYYRNPNLDAWWRDQLSHHSQSNKFSWKDSERKPLALDKTVMSKLCTTGKNIQEPDEKIELFTDFFLRTLFQNILTKCVDLFFSILHKC